MQISGLNQLTLLHRRLAAGLLALSLPCLSGIAFADPAADPVVIRLGGQEITRSELNRRFEVSLAMLIEERGAQVPGREQVERLREQFLSVRAMELVLLQEAARRGLSISETELDAAIDELLAEFSGHTGSDDKLEVMERIKVENRERLRGIVREKQLINRVNEALTEEVEVPPGDVITMHHDVKDQMAIPEQVCIQQILLEDEQTAQRLLKQLNDGAEFAGLARRHSTDTATAEQGGDMGCFARGRGGSRTPFESAVFNATQGEVVGPVESRFGYHLIKVYDRKPRRIPTLNEAYEQIEIELKQEQLPSKLAALREESGVRVFPDRLGPLPE